MAVCSYRSEKKRIDVDLKTFYTVNYYKTAMYRKMPTNNE